MTNLSFIDMLLALKTLKLLQGLVHPNLLRFPLHVRFEVLMNIKNQFLVLFNIRGAMLNDHLGDDDEGVVKTEDSEQEEDDKANHLPDHTERVCLSKITLELEHRHADTHANECLNIDSLDKGK